MIVQPAGLPDALLPATWWQHVPQPWLTPGLLPVLREATIELFRPLVPGEELCCSVQLERLQQRGNRQYVDCALHAAAGGVLVATATARLVVSE